MGTLFDGVNTGYNAPCANRVYLEEERKEIIAKIMIIMPRIAYISMPTAEPSMAFSKRALL